MSVVAAKTRDAARVHQALHEVIALHAIFVRGAIGKMGKRKLAQFVILELPEIHQLLAHMKADRPVVILALDGIGER